MPGANIKVVGEWLVVLTVFQGASVAIVWGCGLPVVLLLRVGLAVLLRHWDRSQTLFDRVDATILAGGAIGAFLVGSAVIVTDDITRFAGGGFAGVALGLHCAVVTLYSCAIVLVCRCGGWIRSRPSVWVTVVGVWIASALYPVALFSVYSADALRETLGVE